MIALAAVVMGTTAAMAAPNASGSSIYGWLGFADTDDDNVYAGFCEVHLDGSYTCLFPYKGLTSYGFWIRDHKVCNYGFHEFFGMLFGNEYDEYDLETGDLVNKVQMSTSDRTQVVLTHTYDPVLDKIYGFTWDSTGNAYKWFSADGSNPSELNHIADLAANQFCVALTVNQVTHELIGVNAARKLVSIDPATGVQTVLKDIDIDFEYVTGMCYSPIDGYYIWNEVDRVSEISHLYAIDPETYEFTQLCVCDDMANYTGMYCTDTRGLDPNAPADPLVKQVNFAKGATTGYVVYATPTATAAGDPISGRIGYEAFLDNEHHTSGTIPAGNDLFVPFANLETGYHSFTLTLSLDGALSRDAYWRGWIGHDNPMAPEEVLFEDEGISWTPVTQSVHNGYLDLDKLVYDVYVDDTLVASDLKATHLAYTLPEGVYTCHRAKVVAKANGMESEPKVSNGLLRGTPLSLPMTLAPTEEEAQLFNIVDWNADGTTFDYFRAYDGDWCFAYHFSASRPATDWLFLPAFAIEDTSKVYELSWDAFVGDARYPEAFDIWLGENEPTPYGMVGGQHILPNTTISNHEPQRMSVNFTVSRAKAYFIGFRCNSEKNMYLLCLRNFEVKETTLSQAGPQKVTNVEATPAPLGGLTADVKMTLPTKDMKGRDLDANAQITIDAVSEAGSASVTGVPGATVSVTVPTNNGDNLITLTGKIGDNVGNTEKVNVYTGIDRPGLVNNLKMEAGEDNMTLTLTWEPNEVGANGGYAPHASTYYYLCVPEGDRWKSIKNLGKEVTTCSVTLPAGTELQMCNYGILTLNEQGQADYLQTASCVAGIPHALPMKEFFAGDAFTYNPVLLERPDASYTASWAFDSPSKVDPSYMNGGNKALIVYSNSFDPVKGRCLLPKFATAGSVNPMVSLKVLNVGCQAKVYARTYNTDFVEIADLSNCPEAYETVSMALPAPFNNAKWVQLALDVTVPSYASCLVIDGYTVRDVRNNDLSVTALDGPWRLQLGEDNEIEVSVTNEGSNEASLREGELTVLDSKGNKLVVIPTAADQALKPMDGVFTVKCNITPTVDWGKNVKVRFSLRGNDDNAANNTTETSFDISNGDKVVVDDLHCAGVGDSYVDLAWSEPLSANGHESFEDCDGTIHSPATLGVFKNFDLDGKGVYGIQGSTRPDLYEAGAFTAYSTQALADDRLTASEGDMFIISYCPADGSAANDMLISPLVDGGTTLSFKARALTYLYGPETIEILTSSTGDNISDFSLLKTVKISGQSGVPTVWESVEVDLPANAKYFAIRYVSADVFAVMLDDFRFSAAGVESPVAGYDVVRNGETIASNISPVQSWRDNTIAPDFTEYYYNVVPVLKDGSRSVKSNTLIVKPGSVSNVMRGVITASAGEIIIKGYGGCKVVVSDASGVLLYESANAEDNIRIPAAQGVYMVKADKDVRKVRL